MKKKKTNEKKSKKTKFIHFAPVLTLCMRPGVQPMAQKEYKKDFIALF